MNEVVTVTIQNVEGIFELELPLDAAGHLTDEGFQHVVFSRGLFLDNRALFLEPETDWRWTVCDVDTEDTVGTVTIHHGAGA